MDDALVAVILAGGKSTRFGSDKASALLAGRPLIEWVLTAALECCDSVVVVKARGQSLPALDVGRSHVEVVEDFIDARGPLAGLVAGLRAIDRPLAFATSCDVPLLRPRLISALAHMVDRYDAVVPEVDGQLQPLVAAYRRSTCLPAFERALSNGRLRLTDALRHLDVRVVAEGEVAIFDPELRSFMNANERAVLDHIAARLTAEKMML